MKIAFCLFKYFPYGGLQRDFLKIAKECIQQGHEVHVYTMQWEGEPLPNANLHIVPIKRWTNYGRCLAFSQAVAVLLKSAHYDTVIGFNKMPGLDWYYAADVCYETRVRMQRGWFYRLLPRYKAWHYLEASVFTNPQTKILLISPLQQVAYQECYATSTERFYLLPPGISKDRIAPDNASSLRKTQREAWHIKENEMIILMVGSGFRTKGVDRAIKAFAAMTPTLRSRCYLWIIGKDRPGAFLRLAEKHQISDRVRFLGGRDDVPLFLLAADLLLHPAYHENTGTVLLEALVAGLPVLTVDVCGYAHFVKEAHAGKVMTSPFKQAELNLSLQEMLVSSEQTSWRQHALLFTKTADLYGMAKKAVALITHQALGENA